MSTVADSVPKISHCSKDPGPRYQIFFIVLHLRNVRVLRPPRGISHEVSEAHLGLVHTEKCDLYRPLTDRTSHNIGPDYIANSCRFLVEKSTNNDIIHPLARELTQTAVSRHWDRFTRVFARALADNQLFNPTVTKERSRRYPRFLKDAFSGWLPPLGDGAIREIALRASDGRNDVITTEAIVPTIIYRAYLHTNKQTNTHTLRESRTMQFSQRLPHAIAARIVTFARLCRNPLQYARLPARSRERLTLYHTN